MGMAADLDMNLTIPLLNLPKKTPHKIWLYLTKWFKRKRCLKVRLIWIHVYSPRARKRATPCNLFFFPKKYKYSVNVLQVFPL